MIEIVTGDGITVMINVRNIASISRKSYGDVGTVISMVDSAVWTTKTSYNDIRKLVEKVLFINEYNR